jgi:hypothetical protein
MRQTIADAASYKRKRKEFMMASFRDPARTFAPMEVIERLLEIADHYGHAPVLYLSSSGDLTTYLDSLGFDVYSLTTNTEAAFDASGPTVLVLPNGSRSHESATAH